MCTQNKKVFYLDCRESLEFLPIVLPKWGKDFVERLQPRERRRHRPRPKRPPVIHRVTVSAKNSSSGWPTLCWLSPAAAVSFQRFPKSLRRSRRFRRSRRTGSALSTSPSLQLPQQQVFRLAWKRLGWRQSCAQSGKKSWKSSYRPGKSVTACSSYELEIIDWETRCLLFLYYKLIHSVDGR